MSAGCGSDESLPRRCGLETSWGRRLEALLGRLLGTHAVRVQIWAKGGAQVDFHARCTRRFVDGADVVLLEFEPNLLFSPIRPACSRFFLRLSVAPRPKPPLHLSVGPQRTFQ